MKNDNFEDFEVLDSECLDDTIIIQNEEEEKTFIDNFKIKDFKNTEREGEKRD